MRDWHNLSTEMWKVRQRRKAHAELNVGAVDERWKDRAFIIILALVHSCLISIRDRAVSWHAFPKSSIRPR